MEKTAEKKKIVEAVANVKFDPASPSVGDKNFARFAIWSAGGGVHGGRKLFVFDHRSAIVEAAKIAEQAIAENRKNPSGFTAEAKETALESLAKIFGGQPVAKVIVMEKTDGDNIFPYVNLYPANGQKPTALFSENLYTGKHNAGFRIKEDNALWSWTSESSSSTGAHREMVLVALTDEDHRVLVRNWGYANIEHSDKDLTVIGADIQQVAEEEFVVDMEP